VAAVVTAAAAVAAAATKPFPQHSREPRLSE
jgi:hypothetical protein